MMYLKDDSYAIMSHWGHLMAFDQSNQAVRFLPLSASSNQEVSAFSRPAFKETRMRTLSELVLSGNAPSWTVENASTFELVSFRDGDKYIGLRKDGVLFHSNKSNAWEKFFFMSFEDIEILRLLVLSRFCVAGSSSEEIRKIGLRSFSLFWNGYQFPLNQNCPLSDRFDGQRLTLVSGDKSFVFDKVEHSLNKSVIWINPQGNIGNRALQYLTAEGMKEWAQDAEIQNIHLEMWGSKIPKERPPIDACASTGDSCSIDTKGIGDCLARREVDAVAIDSYTFCVDHYPSREKCRKIFPSTIGAGHVTGFGENQLVCNIRGGEILRGVHPNYFPLPVRYYQLLEEESGLELVFYGQIGDDPYSNNLRKNFPRASFVLSQGQEVDFEIIRRSKNIAVSISTFSWLAAWLSHAHKIYLPVGGMFNPVQHPAQDYLPVDDTSFQFVLLPKVKSASLFTQPADFWRVQDRISKCIRFATRAEIREMRQHMHTWPLSKRVMVETFDTRYYCRQYLDAAADVLNLESTALEHYLKTSSKNRQISAFDETAYGAAYPDAEIDVALGYFPDLFHHFICKGIQLGYHTV